MLLFKKHSASGKCWLISMIVDRNLRLKKLGYHDVVENLFSSSPLWIVAESLTSINFTGSTLRLRL